ncbi:hypothetical protein G3580_07520 [Nitrogeniibacter mangrovi]|uniref:Uncharacterized protein n=1 Tax=Nitrogeniibacter mangrovi TaxID=2016596 RepID=A0A6C1B5I9_9RHOO|nr:hypothetical protein [Nitrogeniibacter mangrovi]QID17504.1 hypothetical protein G3580_07520 [Nitrogeniibacter mangrovi]
MRTRTDPPNLQERHHFKALLAENPNHFGHLRHSSNAAVCPIVEDDAYERLVDVGHHGTDDRLVAVVQLSQACGYDSGIDGHGSTEFVRFYLSCDQGNSWHDYGVASFQAYNIARVQPLAPLSFAASVALPHGLRDLGGPIRLRAILSWQLCPPPEQSEWRPVWGAVMDQDILGERRPVPAIDPIDDTAGESTAAFSPDTGYPTGARRAHAYRDAITRHQTEVSAEAFTRLLTDAPPPDDDTPEPHPALQLVTVALDPNTPDAVVAIARFDSPAELTAWHRTHGCYASFWLSDDEGREIRYLGTAAFSVVSDDAANAPLIARLPVDLLPYRRPAAAGTTILELTAERADMRPLSARPPTPAGPPGHQVRARVFLPRHRRRHVASWRSLAAFRSATSIPTRAPHNRTPGSPPAAFPPTNWGARVPSAASSASRARPWRPASATASRCAPVMAGRPKCSSGRSC